LQLSQKETNVLKHSATKICRLKDKRCRQRFYGKKNELVANNGDTLGEAIISVKKMNSDQDSQEKFNLKEQPENRTASSSTIFSSEI
jgi:hypothetical protein